MSNTAPKNTSIFYVNSVGFLCQWKGRIVRKDEASVTVAFSKSKVLKFRLKDLGCDLFITTKTPVKATGLAVDQAQESTSFDEEVKAKLLATLGDNIAEHWSTNGWAA